MTVEGAFAHNPFRQLGLPATATTAEIRRSYEELAVRLDLGATHQELSKDQLGAIKQALDDPVRRMRSSLFWLHSPRDLVDPAIKPHDTEAVGAAIARLKGQAGRPAGREQAIALHDLAVLSYLAYLEGSDRNEHLELALTAWAEITEGSQFWAYVKDRASEVGDQRLTEDAVERMRAELPTAVLEPLAKSAATGLSAGDVTSAADLTQTIRRSGLPEGAVDDAVKTATAPLRARIQHGLRVFDERMDELGPAPGERVSRSEIDAVQTLLIEQVLGPAAQLHETDPVQDDAVLADRVAQALRHLSVMCSNELQEWDRSLVLMKEALDTARSPHLVSELAGEHALVRNQCHLSEANAAWKANDLPRAAAHMELAVPYAENAQEAREQEQEARAMRHRIGVGRAGEVDARKEEATAWLAWQSAVFANRIRAAAGLPVEEQPEPPASRPVAVHTSKGPPSTVTAGPPEAPHPSSTGPRPRKWIAICAACVALVALVLGGGKLTSSNPEGPSLAEIAARKAEADERYRQALREQRARFLREERAIERRQAQRRARARRRARERRRRQAARRAAVPAIPPAVGRTYSCSVLESEVSRAQERAQRGNRRLDALRGNPQAYNALLPEVNALIQKYNNLLDQKCDPQ